MATVPEQIRLVAEPWPDGCACRIADGPSMSYGEWEATANRLARSLVDAGVQRGDPVLLAFDDDDLLAHLQAYLGVQKAAGFCVILPM